MLARCSPISVQMRPSTPESFAIVTSIRAVWSGRAGPSAQRRSIQRSELCSKASSSAQSMAWISTPLPRTAMPTMRSPGIGLQQGAGRATWPRPEADDDRRELVALRQRRVAQQLGVERGDQVLAGHLGGAEPGEHVLGLLEPEPLRRGLERLVGRLLADPLERDAGDLAAEPHLGGALLAAQAAPDRRLGAAGDHHVLPGRLRPLALGADDRHRLAVAELGPERHPLAIDLGADAASRRSGCGSRRRSRSAWRRAAASPPRPSG